jgi:hypothetical protein
MLVLDTTPLGLVTQRPGVQDADACRRWLDGCIDGGWSVIVPEIADYELRRELRRAGSTGGIRRLDAFNAVDPGRYLPITTAAMRRATDLWALARNSGWATAHPHALDGDAILAAQALELLPAAETVLVVTSNTAHMTRYVPAARWEDVTP